jgi:hypothetical protein
MSFDFATSTKSGQESPSKMIYSFVAWLTPLPRVDPVRFWRWRSLITIGNVCPYCVFW